MMESPSMSPSDPNSFSRPDLCQVTNVHLNIVVDFNESKLKGHVELEVQKISNEANNLILDTRDLSILGVFCDGSKLEYKLGEAVGTYGKPLEIQLPSNSLKHSINVKYETSSKSSALQWMTKEQTAGKLHPYLYSHSEAIHARSMLPCQDTPSVKTPYTSTVSAPKSLMVLMSAIRKGQEADPSNPENLLHKFAQKVPIPSYLIAIVVGALEGKKIGPRTHVWSEKELIEQAAYEFAQTEEMLTAAESFLGPYLWEIYDLLVLPPSFPLGGMENPCLTFVTPTILAGDRSLANVVAHEISHSWTGNLVTNRNFEHFWLNEGFTVFVERKIISKLSNEKERHFKALGGWKELQYEIDTLGSSNPLTKLVVNLEGVDPDDAFSSVPYEKGHTFLFYLQELLGGNEPFEGFLRAYVEKFKYKSIDTNIFKEFLFEHFKDKVDELNKVDWQKWLHEPGMPPVMPNYDSSLEDNCKSLSESWIASDDLEQFSSGDISKFSSAQIIEFLALLLQAKKSFSPDKLELMTELYSLRSTKNSEIRFRWIRLGLINHWNAIVDAALEFVTEQGRMKFVRPIFRDLYAWEETRQRAIDTFLAHEPYMMHVLSYTVKKDLHLK